MTTEKVPHDGVKEAYEAASKKLTSVFLDKLDELNRIVGFGAEIKVTMLIDDRLYNLTVGVKQVSEEEVQTYKDLPNNQVSEIS